MSKAKSIACRKDMIAVGSSSSDANDHKSLGAGQEQTIEAHASTHDAGLSSVMPQRQGGPFTVGSIFLHESTRPSGRTTFQCKFVLLSQRHV
jgi:hypothetical protein